VRRATRWKPGTAPVPSQTRPRAPPTAGPAPGKVNPAALGRRPADPPFEPWPAPWPSRAAGWPVVRSGAAGVPRARLTPFSYAGVARRG
jgi:hypothetical protein